LIISHKVTFTWWFLPVKEVEFAVAAVSLVPLKVARPTEFLNLNAAVASIELATAPILWQ
jgi:hypothetical protein